VVDFVLVLIELVSPALTVRRYERILVKIVVFERGWVTLSTNFRGKKECRPPMALGSRNLESLGYHVALFA